MAAAITCLLPIFTLFHKNVMHRWVLNRSLFIAPDEFSYVLTARNIAAGRGIALRAPLDTFYPPGFPAILAAWGKIFGFNIFSMHVCVVVTGCVATFFTLLLVRNMVIRGRWPADTAGPPPMGAVAWPAMALLALLITAIYATSLYTLENELSVLSEPAFTLCIAVWLLLALKWPQWWRNPIKSVIMAGLCAAAMSMRSAAIICFGATAGAPWVDCITAWWQTRQSAAPRLIPFSKLVVNSIIVGLVGAAYLGGVALASPAKNIFSDKAHNGYMHQLIRGLTDRGRIPLYDIHLILLNLLTLMTPHLNDFSHLFCPPAMFSPEYGVFNVVCKMVLLLAMIGFLLRLFFQPRGQSRLIEIFILFYIGLYAIWPFDFVRFWLPILPVMMVYVAEAMGRPARPISADTVLVGGMLKKTPSQKPPATAARNPIIRLSGWPWALLALLLVANVEPAAGYFPAYQDRLNYVSDCLRSTRAALAKFPRTTPLVSMEPFTFAYYTRLPQIPTTPGPFPKTPARQIARLLAHHPHRPILMAGYFGWEQGLFHNLANDLRQHSPAALAPHAARKLRGKAISVRRIFRRDMVTIWRISLRRLKTRNTLTPSTDAR